MRPARRLDPIDRVIALVLGVGYVLLLLSTVKDLGYARDEGFYFDAADAYGRWFSDLWRDAGAAMAGRDRPWSVNREHPALIKSLFALCHLWLQKDAHLFALEGTSYRFPAMVLAGAGLSLVYTWGARVRGRSAGIAAALLLGAMPRFFYQSHLACFDIPIVTLWLACAYCWWRAVSGGGAAWVPLTGLAFGLALDTKHNSWFLPFALLTHAALLEARDRLPWRRPEAEAEQTAQRELLGTRRRRMLGALLAMATLGPLVFWALWPWLWSRFVFARLAEYAAFHLGHEYYNMEFFGRTYWEPPMPLGYAWVMTAATVPAITLALAVSGMGLSLRAPLGRVRGWWRARASQIRNALPRARATDDPGGATLLWAIGLGISYAAWLSPKTPIFGGTKHWMTAYPFLCLFAGLAFGELVRRARVLLARWWPRIAPRASAMRRLARGPLPEMALAAAVMAAPITETVRSHPWGLSSYTPLVGGAAGAATLGLNRTFWGYTTGAVVEWLNREAPRGAKVYVHDTSWPAWQMLREEGRLRRDIEGAGSLQGADLALYHHEQHMAGQEYQAWVAFGTTQPAHVAGLDGVPVIWIYRPAAAR
ncbi:MAG: glycosyltransferase family 39 protein [Polyangiaceae bacterium]